MSGHDFTPAAEPMMTSCPPVVAPNIFRYAATHQPGEAVGVNQAQNLEPNNPDAPDPHRDRHVLRWPHRGVRLRPHRPDHHLHRRWRLHLRRWLHPRRRSDDGPEDPHDRPERDVRREPSPPGTGRTSPTRSTAGTVSPPRRRRPPRSPSTRLVSPTRAARSTPSDPPPVTPTASRAALRAARWWWGLHRAPNP